MNNKNPLYYAEYLQLDKILGAQKPESEKSGTAAHDETLFIIIHQTYELWFKQILHEIDSMLELFQQDYIPENALHTVVLRLKRVTEIQKVLNDQIRIIETMTPLDFLDFRDSLQPASGFQSLQFRQVEVKLGLKYKYRNEMEKKFFNIRLSKEDQKLLAKVDNEPSVFEMVEKWLERMPFDKIDGGKYWKEFKNIVASTLDHDRKVIENNPFLPPEQKKMELNNLNATLHSFEVLFDDKEYQKVLDSGERRLSRRATLSAIFILLNRDEPILSLPFEIIQALLDIDELFTIWRYRHAMMAQRLLGSKIGTGGSSGHEYLRKTTESSRIFTDFFNLASFLIPRKQLPVLSNEVKTQLGFSFQK
ncbi:MAG: tryptophan 2,3-dioxygenase [Bacteriovoracaceae bacterium]|nr:tryptophan 2,3-dioxygenase [Bacteriovoracaceae bacterium]